MESSSNPETGGGALKADPPQPESGEAVGISSAVVPQRWSRYVAVVGFVGLWMGIGILLKLDANQYLLVGVPLTIGFQGLVARKPIRALWVRSSPPLRLTRGWLGATAAIGLLPAVELASGGWKAGPVIVGWLVCAMLGAPAAAYAIQNANRRVAHSAKPAVQIFFFISLLLIVTAVLSRPVLAVFSGTSVVAFLRWTALYFPVCFILEEVTFRGALDAYLNNAEHPDGKSSAMVLSILWGIWHLGAETVPDITIGTIFGVAIWHLVIGTMLSFSWRIGGNLLAPAAAHAAIDGVRNAVLAVG